MMLWGVMILSYYTVTYGHDKLPLLLFRPEMGTRILGPCQSLGALFKQALHAILRKTKGFRSFAPLALYRWLYLPACPLPLESSFQPKMEPEHWQAPPLYVYANSAHSRSVTAFPVLMSLFRNCASIVAKLAMSAKVR